MNTQWQTYKELELITQAEAARSESETLAARINRVVRSIARRLLYPSHYSHSVADMPEIKRGSEGTQPWWYVCDAATGEMTYLESEQDVDRWLEAWFRQ